MNQCPRCGQAIVEYRDVVIEGGYEIERKWHACPVYRDLGPDYPEHVGYWHRGEVRPAPRLVQQIPAIPR